jgi:hypothetical protein
VATRDEKVAQIRHWEQTVDDVGMMVRVLLEAEHVRTITRLTDEGLVGGASRTRSAGTPAPGREPPPTASPAPDPVQPRLEVVR